MHARNPQPVALLAVATIPLSGTRVSVRPNPITPTDRSKSHRPSHPPSTSFQALV